MSRSTAYFVYILRSDRNQIYIGLSRNIEKRLERHISRQGALFLKNDNRFSLVYREGYPTLVQAMRREKQLKGWTRAKKETLIANNLQLLKKL